MAEPSSTRLRSGDKAQEPIAAQGSGAQAEAAGLWARLGLARGAGPLCLSAALAPGVAPALPVFLVALGQLLWGAREFKTRLLFNGSREAPAALLPGRGRVCRVAAALQAGVASARASAAERLFTAL